MPDAAMDRYARWTEWDVYRLAPSRPDLQVMCPPCVWNSERLFEQWSGFLDKGQADATSLISLVLCHWLRSRHIGLLAQVWRPNTKGHRQLRGRKRPNLGRGKSVYERIESGKHRIRRKKERCEVCGLVWVLQHSSWAQTDWNAWLRIGKPKKLKVREGKKGLFTQLHFRGI